MRMSVAASTGRIPAETRPRIDLALPAAAVAAAPLEGEPATVAYVGRDRGMVVPLIVVQDNLVVYLQPGCVVYHLFERHDAVRIINETCVDNGGVAGPRSGV